MSLRTYLLLLRPIRTLALAAFILPTLFVLIGAVLGPSNAEFVFVALCLVTPLTLGSLLIAPLHEVAHRSSFPLLPGAGRHLHAGHFIGFGVAALLLGALAALCVSVVPGHAACGLVIACLALPLLNPNRAMGFGASAVFVPVLIISLILATAGHHPLIQLGTAAPWLLFVGGIAVAYTCFRIGFDPARLRARSANPFYYAPQSTLLFVGTDVLQHAQAEALHRREHRRSRAGVDWAKGTFRDTLHGWLSVLHHARFGQSRLSCSSISVFFATAAGLVAGLFTIVFLDAGLDSQKWEAYCRLLVETARGSGEITNSDIRLSFIVVPLVSYSIVLASAVLAGVPPRPFPIARSRLANVLFLAFERRTLLALAGGIVGTAAVLAMAALVANEPWSFALLHRFLPLPVVALIAANLLPMAVFSRGALTQIFFGLLAFPGFIIATFAIVFRDSGSSSSVFSIAIFSILTLASLAFTWSTFRRHYRTCDLTRTGDALRQLGFRLG